jgi:hypothetical protein
MNHPEPSFTSSPKRNRLPLCASFLLACLVCFFAALPLSAQDFPKMPEPTKEHQWLQQFVGEWECDMEMTMAPGQPTLKAKSTENARMLGGFWLLAESKGEIMGMPFTSVFTIGYDPAAKKYTGTWVDSAGSYLWKYEGSVDTTGKILTLESEGPCPMRGGLVTKFRESTEFKSSDLRVLTSRILGEDGKWTTIATMTSRRKK